MPGFHGQLSCSLLKKVKLDFPQNPLRRKAGRKTGKSKF